MNVTAIRAPLPGEHLAAVEPTLSPDVRDHWNRRLNLYPGRALSDVALTMEQASRAGRLATTGQRLSAGILDGLEVALEREDGSRKTRYFYHVSAGSALAASGEDVHVPQALRVNVLDALVCGPAATLDPHASPEAAPQRSYSTDLLPRAVGPTLGHLLKERKAAGHEDDATLPRVGLLLLQPVVMEMVGTAVATDASERAWSDPCEQDPADFAFEDWQRADGTRLLFYPWPLEWRPLPRADVLRRNRIAHTIFEAERALAPDELLPWEPYGVPIALVAFNRRWKPLFADRGAVARAGGKPRRRTVVLPGAGSPFLWQARVEQFAEQVAEAGAVGVPAADLARQFRHLPPVGLLPRDVADPRAGRDQFFPPSFAVEAVPVPQEQLDLAMEASAPLAPYDTFRGDEVQLLVPVPQQWYEPGLLRTEEVDPEFAATIDRYARRRSKILRRRIQVRDRADALDVAAGSTPVSWPDPDPAALEKVETVADDPIDPDDPFLAAPEDAFGLDLADGAIATVTDSLPVVKDAKLVTTDGQPSGPPTPRPAHRSVHALEALRGYLRGSTPIMRTYTQVLTGPDMGLKLPDALPADLADLRARVRYDERSKVLSFRGPMSVPEYEELAKVAAQQPYQEALRALLLQSQDDDLAQLDALGIRGFANMLEAKVNEADDRIDMGFTRVQTDIYRARQNMLGTSAATRLATSPVLASIAQGESALATQTSLSEFMTELKTQQQVVPPAADGYQLPSVPPRTPGGAGGMASAAFAVANGGTDGAPLVATDTGTALVTGTATATRTAFPPVSGNLFTAGAVDMARASVISAAPGGGATITAAPATTLALGGTLAGTLGTAVNAIEEALATQPGLRAAMSSAAARAAAEAGPRAPALPIISEVRDQVVGQAPIVGKALNFRTVTLAERLEEPRAPEAKNYAVATKADILRALSELKINVDDLEVPGFYVYKEDTGELDAQQITAKLPGSDIERVVRVVPKERTHTVLDIRTYNLAGEVLQGLHDLDPLNGDEGAFFSASVRALDHTVAFLRLVEGRLQAYRAVIEHCRSVLADVVAARASAATRLGVLEGELAETRQDVAVARALLADETARVAKVNERRDTIMRDHVRFLAYRRPRARDLFRDAPSRQLDPGVVEAPLPACLASGVTPPAQLTAMVELLRDVPVRWFAYLPPLLDRLDRVDVMQDTLRYAKVRAAVQYQTKLLLRQEPPRTNALGDAIQRAVAAQQDAVSAYRLRTAQFDLSELAQQTWRFARDRAEDVLSLGDLLDAPHGRPDVVQRGAEEMRDIGRVAGCLYAHFGDVMPALRLVWAEQLSQYDAPVSLRNLASLPRWGEIEYLERRGMQSMVDWLFGRIDPGQAEAVHLMNDVVRVALLLASHAPVNQIVTGDVPQATTVREGGSVELTVDPAKVRVGMQVLLYAEPVEATPTVVARAVVEDLGGGRASARVIQAAAPTVSLEATAKAQIVEPDHPTLAVATQALDAAARGGDSAVAKPGAGRFGGVAGRAR